MGEQKSALETPFGNSSQRALHFSAWGPPDLLSLEISREFGQMSAKKVSHSLLFTWKTIDSNQIPMPVQAPVEYSNLSMPSPCYSPCFSTTQISFIWTCLPKQEIFIRRLQRARLQITQIRYNINGRKYQTRPEQEEFSTRKHWAKGRNKY